MEEIKINTEFIKLNQLLKLAGVVDQGSDVKNYLINEMVFLNGNLVTERGKKIRPEDTVEIKGICKIHVTNQ